MSAIPPKEEEFSALERAALARWRAPLPPVGFAERVVARSRAEAEPAAPPRSRLAVAALALLVLGGALSVRTILDGSAGSPTYHLPGGIGGHDAGPRPEVHTDVRDDIYDDVYDDVQPQAQEEKAVDQIRGTLGGVTGHPS